MKRQEPWKIKLWFGKDGDIHVMKIVIEAIVFT